MQIEASQPRVRRYFSQAQKELILREHIVDGVPISQLAKKMGSSDNRVGETG
jgi:transposase-like protein